MNGIRSGGLTEDITNETVVKKRLFFKKQPDMHLIGHLDLMRVFQRSINRGEIPVGYSQGYNPHQIMSFAIPLPVGFHGEKEILDIGLYEDMENSSIQGKINASLPAGLLVVDCQSLDESDKSAASTVIRGLYAVDLPEQLHHLREGIDTLLEASALPFERETRKGVKIDDARDKIFDLWEDSGVIYMDIATGSQKNLRPDVILSLLTDCCDSEAGKIERDWRWANCLFVRKKLILATEIAGRELPYEEKESQ